MDEKFVVMTAEFGSAFAEARKQGAKMVVDEVTPEFMTFHVEQVAA